MAAMAAGGLIVTTLLTWYFVSTTALRGSAVAIAALSIPIVLLGGFLIAAICGYMAGLIAPPTARFPGSASWRWWDVRSFWRR